MVFRRKKEVAENEIFDDDDTVEGLNDRARLLLHERICAERYKAINARLGRIEKILIGTASSLLLGMGGIIANILVSR